MNIGLLPLTSCPHDHVTRLSFSRTSSSCGRVTQRSQVCSQVPVGTSPSFRHTPLPSVHSCVSFSSPSSSGASPLGSPRTRRVGGRQKFVRCATPFPFLRLLPCCCSCCSSASPSCCGCSPSTSACRSSFASSSCSLLLVALPLLVSRAARLLGHLHRGVAA